MKDENSALHAKAEVAKPLAVVLLTLNWHATSAALEATYATLSWYALWGVAVISLLLQNRLKSNVSSQLNAHCVIVLVLCRTLLALRLRSLITRLN